MQRNAFLAVAVLGAVAGGAALFAWIRADRGEVPVPPAPASQPATRQAALPAQTASRPGSDLEGMPDEFYRKYPPLSKVAITLPRVTSGIRMPDGSYLPLLNGVPHAPPVSRDRFLPPPGRIVAKYTDTEGDEWWIHEDGSTTTTRFVEATYQDGSKAKVIVTDHAAALPDAMARPVSPDEERKALERMTQQRKQQTNSNPPRQQ
ncbi:MAG: hypothetical protein IT458_06200 [Planctomycetes bacterium]|nr:hypothetical protein [Planctomycetota bacterium]